MIEQPHFEIRLTRNDDCEHLPEVERSAAARFASIPELAWIATADVHSVEDHQRFVTQKNSWVAIHDDQPIGFISGVQMQNAFHICEFSVREEWQSQGVGKALMQALEADMADKNVTNITLTTFRKVEWNGPMYEHLGFVEIPDAELSLFLLDVLGEETEAGFLPDQRCAMRKTLT